MEKNIGFNIIDSPEWESVIEVLAHSEIQKHLNQWRHTYDIVILSCYPIMIRDHDRTYLSIMRKPRSA